MIDRCRPERGPHSCRAVFLSDVHLGSRACRAEALLDFLDGIAPDTLYLVGDILDFWALRKRLFWPKTHERVLRRLLDFSRAGTRVIYVPGNHDGYFRRHLELVVSGITIRRQIVHETVDGKRLLVLHGDEFDLAVRTSRLLSWLGDRAYVTLLTLNRLCAWWRRRRGLPYWSLAGWLKERSSAATQAVDAFERAAAQHARKRGADGIVCGHIHRANDREIDGVRYLNDGDWVESCTALVEEHDGRIRLHTQTAGTRVEDVAEETVFLDALALGRALSEG